MGLKEAEGKRERFVLCCVVLKRSSGVESPLLGHPDEGGSFEVPSNQATESAWVGENRRAKESVHELETIAGPSHPFPIVHVL